jgi:pimeloyl-CoA synthetase
MSKPQKLSVNVETGEEILVDLNKDEILEFEASVKALENETLTIKTNAKAKEEAKSSAQTKLAALGLTADDLKALGL